MSVLRKRDRYRQRYVYPRKRLEAIFYNYDLGTEDFEEAVNKAKEVVMREVKKIREDAYRFYSDNSIEFDRLQGGRKMLIRSQNKAVLLNFSNLAAIYTVKDGDDFIISSLEGENKCTLGKYSTKAKAMKVLDMIQEAYVNGHIDYQMPADSEVEV